MSATNCGSGVPRSGNAPGPPGGWRLAWLVLAALVAAAVIGGVVRRAWARLEQLQGEFVTIEAESFSLGIRLRSGLERLNGALLRFQLSRADPGERDLFEAEAKRLAAALAQTKPLLVTAQERELAAELEAAFADYLNRAAPLLENRARAVRRDSAAEVGGQIREITEPLERLCERLIQAQQVSWNGFLDTSHRAVGDLWQASMVALLLLVGFAVIILFLAYRATVAPLRHQLSETRWVLERQEKLASLGTLAAGVAHEIRNPLASLKLRLFSLKQSLPAEFARHEDVLVIDDEINRLERIIKDFLQFARPSEPAMGNTATRPILEAVQGLLQAPLAARGVQLVLEPGESFPLRADPQQLQQALINLVQNAADSIDGRGTVTLRARQGAARLAGRSGPTVIIEVADTGKGIPAEVQKRLFDPFFSTRADGTGLGLPISERIVEKHGGFIQYQTQADRGTSFQIVLPQAPNHASHHPDH